MCLMGREKSVGIFQQTGKEKDYVPETAYKTVKNIESNLKYLANYLKIISNPSWNITYLFREKKPKHWTILIKVDKLI